MFLALKTSLPLVFSIFWILVFFYSVFAKTLCKMGVFAIPFGLITSLLYFCIKSKLGFQLLGLSASLNFVFFSSLFLSMISDLVEMTVPRISSIWLVPFWFLFAKLNLLSIGFYESLFGAFFGYLIPFGIAKVFKFFKGKDGLGLGDVELFSMIGAFLGFEALILTLNVASISCLVFYAIRYFVFKNISPETAIPFAPFISFGALVASFVF